MRYAGLRAFLAIAAGIALQSAVHLPVWFLGAYALACAASVRLTRGYSLLLALASVSALYLHAASFDPGPTPYELKTRFTATVLAEPIPIVGNRAYSVRLDSIRVGGRCLPLGLKARMTSGRYLPYGSRFALNAALYPFTYPRNPGLMDMNQYYRRQGFAGRLSPQGDVIKYGNRGGDLLSRALIMPVRRHFIDVLGRFFRGENRALLAGLLLGEKGDMPLGTRAAFADTGTAHILAVSGLNVSILVGACLLLLSVLGVQGRIRLVVASAVALLYVGITGFPPSALRAGLMAIAAAAGLTFERRYDALNAVCISGIIILAFDPASLLDTGFQLSFAATAAIAAFYERTRDLVRRIGPNRYVRNWLISPAAVVLLAQLGALPLTIFYFYQVSSVSLLANLAIVPLVGVGTPLGMLLMVAAPVSTGIAAPFAATLNLTASAIIWMADRLAALPWAAVVTGKPPVPVIIWLYCLIIMLFWFNRAPTRKIFGALALAGLGVMVWVQALRPGRLEMTFLDAQEGEAALCSFPGGTNMLVDAGSPRNRIVETFLKSRGLSSLDALVLTSSRPDAIAAVDSLLERFRTRHLVLPFAATPDSKLDTLATRARSKGAKLHALGRGDEVPGLCGDVRCLSPSPLIRALAKDGSLSPARLALALRVSSQGRSALLAGSLDDERWLEGESLRSDVLLAPGKGSPRVNSDWLLDQVRPHWTIVSGRLRPDPRLVARAQRRGIRIHSLRRDGALTWIVDRSGSRVQTLYCARDEERSRY